MTTAFVAILCEKLPTLLPGAQMLDNHYLSWWLVDVSKYVDTQRQFPAHAALLSL